MVNHLLAAERLKGGFDFCERRAWYLVGECLIGSYEFRLAVDSQIEPCLTSARSIGFKRGITNIPHYWEEGNVSAKLSGLAAILNTLGLILKLGSTKDAYLQQSNGCWGQYLFPIFGREPLFLEENLQLA